MNVFSVDTDSDDYCTCCGTYLWDEVEMDTGVCNDCALEAEDDDS